jgi:guanylate kinase
VILRIDVQGVRRIKGLAPDSVCIFLAPGSQEELERRLHLRRTDSAEQIAVRLAKAREEMDEIDLFDYVVINSEARLDEAVGQIRAIIVAEKQRVMPRQVRL